MRLQEMYYISEMFVGVAVISSIVFVALQLKQNTYMLNQTMADDRKKRIDWLTETICLDSDFRDFHRRIGIEYDQMNEDARYRAFWLGVRSLHSMLDELVGYFDGNITDSEFRVLELNLKNAKSRPHVEAAYQSLKASYPMSVQNFWEDLEIGDQSALAPALSLDAAKPPILNN